MSEFKPNVMPLMYWALAFGAAAGILLFILYLLSEYILIFWVPVFLVGMAWGGWRNYQQQKKRWYTQVGAVAPTQTITQEFREAASDIANVSREFLNQDGRPEPTREEFNSPLDSTMPDPQVDETRPPDGK